MSYLEWFVSITGLDPLPMIGHCAGQQWQHCNNLGISLLLVIYECHGFHPGTILLQRVLHCQNNMIHWPSREIVCGVILVLFFIMQCLGLINKDRRYSNPSTEIGFWLFDLLVPQVQLILQKIYTWFKEWCLFAKPFLLILLASSKFQRIYTD